MEIRHLRYFLSVADEGGFTSAARRLRVAQPALSRQIRDLEEEIGAPLFSRGNRGARLTPAGEVFREEARRLVAGAARAADAALRRHRGETGRLRIGFIGSLSGELLPRALRSYCESCPEVVITLAELGPTRQREALLAGELDLGLLGLTVARTDPELKLTMVAEESLVAALPEAHPLARRARLALSELHAEPFVLTARANAPVFNPWVLRLCRAAGFEPTLRIEADRSPTALAYVAAGFGVSIFPRPVARAATPGVVFVPLTGNLLTYRFMAGWRTQDENPAIPAFLAALKRSAKAAS
jgi:DNA-binding transcriptional LysR family regulator